jgi:type I restriction enzyme S subunit
MKKLILIRHAERPEIKDNKVGLDVLLTEQGKQDTALDETNVSIYPKSTLIVVMYGQGKTRGQITELLENAGT